VRVSDRLRAESAFVRSKLGDSIICQRCMATLNDYADKCPAGLSEPCDGFLAIEKAKEEFKQDNR
jgi:hypothetical protein